MKDYTYEHCSSTYHHQLSYYNKKSVTVSNVIWTTTTWCPQGKLEPQIPEFLGNEHPHKILRAIFSFYQEERGVTTFYCEALNDANMNWKQGAVDECEFGTSLNKKLYQHPCSVQNRNEKQVSLCTYLKICFICHVSR